MNIEKTIILLVFCLITNSSFGQKATETKISELISRLNWESVTIDCNYDLVLTQTDSISNELVKVGKPATIQILDALKTSKKTVALHIILTRIYEDTENKIAGIGTKYIRKNCKESIGWHHIYNGIYWEWFSGKGQSITESQIKLVSDYWNKKLILKTKSEVPNYDEIIKRLTLDDNEKYPCKR